MESIICIQWHTTYQKAVGALWKAAKWPQWGLCIGASSQRDMAFDKIYIETWPELSLIVNSTKFTENLNH